MNPSYLVAPQTQWIEQYYRGVELWGAPHPQVRGGSGVHILFVLCQLGTIRLRIVIPHAPIHPLGARTTIYSPIWNNRPEILI